MNSDDNLGNGRHPDGLRSGGWFQGNNRQAAGRFFSNQEMELANIGFRVVRTTD